MMKSNQEIERPGTRQMDLLDSLSKSATQYFLDYTHSVNGLVADSTWENAPASIAAVGFGLSVLLVAIERGWLTRAEGIERTLISLRFFANSPQSPDAQATGYQGFYNHFLDIETGQRAVGS